MFQPILKKQKNQSRVTSYSPRSFTAIHFTRVNNSKLSVIYIYVCIHIHIPIRERKFLIKAKCSAENSSIFLFNFIRDSIIASINKRSYQVQFNYIVVNVVNLFMAMIYDISVKYLKKICKTEVSLRYYVNILRFSN